MEDALKKLEELRFKRDQLSAKLNAWEDGTIPVIAGILKDREWVFAKDVAYWLSLTESNANNRLKKLVDFGLATRRREPPVKGGKRYKYRLTAAARRL